jgi:imidazole glycerol-phosphate synthase subunit HisH
VNIAIINYGLGNLHSVHKAVAFAGGDAFVTDDAREILNADKIILPGVGAFADGMRGLNACGLVPVIRKAVVLGKPFLGICLGMQLLFESSEEQGSHQGLGLLSGDVVYFRHPGIRVPQIGWNQIDVRKAHRLLDHINDGDYFYFNHGFYCVPGDQADILTETEYGAPFTSAVQRGNLFGTQFHPEKSQKTGLQILKNFVEI